MRLSRGFRILMLAVGLCVLSSSAMAAVEIHISAGQKGMDSDLKPADDQTAFGIGASFGGVNWPVMIAVDLISSSDDATESEDVFGYEYRYTVDIETTEFNVGVRKFWGQKLRGYVGGGFSFIQLDADVGLECIGGSPVRGGFGCNFEETLINDDDSGTGWWLQAGVGYKFGKRISLNLEATHSDAQVDIEPEGSPLTRGVSLESGRFEVEAGGTRLALMLGIHF